MGQVLDLYEKLTGVVLPYAGSSAPSGFLLCSGQVVNRVDYPNLFSVIGTTYNVSGETAAQFRLPDLRGRVPAGVDNMGGTAASRLTTAGSGLNGATLGAAGGGETHTLTTAQMPQHNHGVTDPGHMHTLQQRLGTTTSGNTYAMQGSADNSTLTTVNGALSNTTGITIQNNGSGQAHPNVQPTLVMNYIIKT